MPRIWTLCVWMTAVLGIWVSERAAGQTASTTFAQRLAASQAVKRALDRAEAQATATGKLYYVRATGSDAANGQSAGAAFRTIQKAIGAVAGSGNTIVVGPGTYGETLSFTSTTASGTANSPNTIFADTEGTLTGDSAGAVTVSGGGSRQNGLTVLGCNYWRFKQLSFSGQTQANVYILPTNYNSTAPIASGLEFDGCTFAVTPYYGLVAYYTGDLTVNDCTFERGATSGFCLYTYSTAATTLKITANRLNRTGSLYDSSGFKNGSLNFQSLYNGAGYSAFAYGIIAMATGTTPTTVRVENNIVSDAFVGVYAYAYGGSHTLRVLNNTVTSSYYGIYAYGYGISGGVISNNLAGNCYLGSYLYLPNGSLLGHMEWGVNYLTAYPAYANTYATSYRQLGSITGFISDQTPTFVGASTGDFSLTQGSAGMDAAYDQYAPSLDAAGVARPIDGNADGSALCDFGAVEAPFIPRLRVVRWKPVAHVE